MDDPNMIATLIATKPLTERAFQFDHNQDRYEGPAGDTRPFTRENTPYQGEDSESENPKDADATSHRLKLTFAHPPKNVSDGYVCGWGSDCDIQLVDRGNIRPGDRDKVGKVSKKHLSITFDAQRRVILRDFSTYGTTISYDGQAGNELRSHFTWIIFPGYQTIEVSIPRADLSFKIKLGVHENCDIEFFANVDRVFPPSVRMGEGGLATPLQQLDMYSQSTSVRTSGTATPRRRLVYLEHERIGKGSFGRVYRVTNVSTGEDLAGKFIDDSDCRREVDIMRQVDHAHIVRFVEYHETSTPVIFMEYLCLGNLDDVHAASPIAFEETATVLSQALQAETYLNARGIIHRDIKPANILVSSREPLVIKLADLGLAKHDRDGLSKFKTFVGTNLYAAPEIYEGNKKPYTYAVDIWSLGMVALQLGYGLPYISARAFSPQEWHCKVFDFIKALDSDILIDFIENDMLRYQPEKRLTASKCLEEAFRIELELGLEKALQTPSRGPASQMCSRASTEKASVLTTLSWAPKDGSKRQRSPGSTSRRDFNKTVFRPERDNLNTSIYSQTYPITNASLWFDGERGPMYESVLQLLKDVQIDSNEATDPGTLAIVQDLCRKFGQLRIAEIIKSVDHDTECVILTAVTEARIFKLASLTSSDLMNPLVDLAHYLHQMMDLLVVHSATADESGTPTDGPPGFP